MARCEHTQQALAAYIQRLKGLPKETLIGSIIWFKVKP